VNGPLKTALNYAHISEMMNFTMVPWGQGVFNVSACGSLPSFADIEYVWGAFWPGYNANFKICFNTICGADANAFAPTGQRNETACFVEPKMPICQHGGAECAVNAIQACAIHQSGNDWTKFGPFAVCMEENYDSIKIPAGANGSSTLEENKSMAQPAIESAIAKCVKGTQLNSADITKCYQTNETDILKSMAMQTVPHTVVPFVRAKQCDGTWKMLQAIPDDATLKDTEPLLLDLICAAACDGSNAKSFCPANASEMAL